MRLQRHFAWNFTQRNGLSANPAAEFVAAHPYESEIYFQARPYALCADGTPFSSQNADWMACEWHPADPKGSTVEVACLPDDDLPWQSDGTTSGGLVVYVDVPLAELEAVIAAHGGITGEVSGIKSEAAFRRYLQETDGTAAGE